MNCGNGVAGFHGRLASGWATSEFSPAKTTASTAPAADHRHDANEQPACKNPIRQQCHQGRAPASGEFPAGRTRTIYPFFFRCCRSILKLIGWPASAVR